MSKIFNFQFSIFNKLKFLLQKPKVIIVSGNARQTTKKAIFQVLKSYFKIGKDIFIFEIDLTDSASVKKNNYLIKYSSLPVLVVTDVGDKEKIIEIAKLINLLPSFGYLILNFDDETIKEIKNKKKSPKEITFGFQEGANFQATDVIINGGTNFKIDYRGSVVPVWLKGYFGKEQIYSVLAATAVGTILGLNLVEISQSFKNS